MSATGPEPGRSHRGGRQRQSDLLWALLPLGLGLGLRLVYALHAEPFVDEPTTLLVAQAVANSGQPVLPSGLFYGNDLPYTYLAGLVVLLFGPNLLALRLLSVGASVAAIALTFHAGRRLFSLQAGPASGPQGRAGPASGPQGRAGPASGPQGRAGLWAALLLALAPQEIIWGGRARAYALLGLLALAAAWLFYVALVKDGPAAGPRRLGLLLLVVAIFVHPEAALLLPTFVLAAVVLRGPRWWLHPVRLAELAVVAAAAAGRYALQLALARGWISGLATLAGSRPPLEPGLDLADRLAAVAPFFLAADRLPWTILAVVALVLAAWPQVRWLATRMRRQSQTAQRTVNLQPSTFNRPGLSVLYLSICLWLPPVLMVLFLGSTYQSPRYLALLLPLFALAAAAGLDGLVSMVCARLRRPRASLLLAIVATLAIIVGYTPSALAAATSREKGFRSALEFVGREWQPGDRVATVAPAYSLLVLGRSDLFTLGQEYEEFVYRAPGGYWADRWAGSPLVRTAADLVAALDAVGSAPRSEAEWVGSAPGQDGRGGRLWLVTDETRLRSRFDPSFAQLAWERMELSAVIDGVLVLRSVDRVEAAAAHPATAVWAGQVALTGYELGGPANRPPGTGWGEVIARPGERLAVTLRWQAVTPVAAEYTAFVHLIGADGRRYAQDDRRPLDGLLPMTHWLPGETLFDRRVLDLPADLPPGRYRLDLGLYDAQENRLPVIASGDGASPSADVLPVDYIRVLAPADREELPTPPHPLAVTLAAKGATTGPAEGPADRVDLLGYDIVAGQAGALRLTLYWQAPDHVATGYTVFAHLLDTTGTICGQGDGLPLSGFYPTTAWDAGEIVVDEHEVRLQDGAPAGPYRLIVGLYDQATGRRLWLGEENVDYVDLGEVP